MIGLFILLGPDTKLMQNCGRTTFKRTSIDRLMNVLVLSVSLSIIHTQTYTHTHTQRDTHTHRHTRTHTHTYLLQVNTCLAPKQNLSLPL
jgi:hypothetical protein